MEYLCGSFCGYASALAPVHEVLQTFDEMQGLNKEDAPAERTLSELKQAKEDIAPPPTEGALSSWQLSHALLISLTGFQEGYHLCALDSLITPIQAGLELCYPCPGGDSDDALADCTCTQKALVTSILLVGAAVGGLTGGTIADSFGRKRVVLLAALLFMAATALCAAATVETWFLYVLGRVLAGLCARQPRAC